MRLQFNENYKAHIVPSVADQDAPTVAEITAGTEVTSFCDNDFLSHNQNEGRVTEGRIDQKFKPQQMGTYTREMSAEYYLDSDVAAGNDAWDEHAAGTLFWLVVFPFGYAGAAPAAADYVNVYYVESGRPLTMDPADNEKQKFSVNYALQTEPSEFVQVAA